MSSLFPDYIPQKGYAIRIYYAKPWKNAYAYIYNGLVTHVSSELIFALGWTQEKLIARAEKVGFSHTCINTMKPRDTWISAHPAPVEVSSKPKRDSKGRFISAKPKKGNP